MKRRFGWILVALLCLLAPLISVGQGGWRRAYYEINGHDTTVVVELIPIVVLPRRIDTRRYARLIANLKKVYPIAKEANRMLIEIERTLPTLPTKREQDRYVKQMERELKEKYTPILKKMTFSQGKILIKLIDRETTETSYELVRELRGGFSAFMWQGVARLFGANLKDEYDVTGEDQMIELLIMLYESGQL